MTNAPSGGAGNGDFDSEIQRLYQLPLQQFTEARNALAVRFHARDREAAARVKSLAKPTASVWAVNQVFWTARSEFDALVDASDRLRALQGAGATANELREVMRDRREALAAAARKAEAALTRHGHAPSASVLQRVATTLEALATYGSARPSEVRPGLLTEDLIPPGFEVMNALAPAAPSRAKTARPSDDAPGPRAAARASEAERSRAERAWLEAEVATKRRQAAAAQAAAEEAARRAEGARSELAEAERRLAKATERAREAGVAARQAQAASVLAARELAAAERKLGI